MTRKVDYFKVLLYTVSQKKLCKMFFVRTSSNFTNFDIFWQKDCKEAKIMRGALISTSSNSRHHTTVLNADVPNTGQD